jgi:TPR repeat protein
MRILDFIRMSAALALTLGVASSGAALDGKQAPSVSEPSQTPLQAFRSGTESYRAGDKKKAFDELHYAAEQGHPLAQWKLGRMYAEGDYVKRDDLKAFQYFSRVASEYAESSPWTPQARFVSNAFVSLGNYYLTGIPETSVRPDPARARDLFTHAASYFGDADAQYQLARLYLDGVGTHKDLRTAARWLGLAAQKGQYQAQATLGQMLFRGEGVPRQAARGLMWLTLARDAAAGPDDTWIVEAYDAAFARATEDERSVALVYLQDWMKTQR